MLRSVVTVAMLILLTACTRMPTEYREQSRLPVTTTSAEASQKLSVVSTAMIGKPVTYTDWETGVSAEIVVQSEYFSANGRMCRRYIEKQSANGAAYPGLSCHSGEGWVDIPVDSFAG